MENLRYRLFFRLHRMWFYFRRPVTLGVRALVTDDRERVLLVKHTYKPGWHLPGGGVNRGETVLESMQRELQEETGVVCRGEARMIPAVYYNTNDYKHDHVLVFVVREWEIKPELKVAGEICDQGFFPLRDLPEGTTPGTRRRIDDFLSKSEQLFKW